jgi:hypothetical protein
MKQATAITRLPAIKAILLSVCGHRRTAPNDASMKNTRLTVFISAFPANIGYQLL